MRLEEVVNCIIPMLQNGCNSVGFVSPSHVIPQVKAIIEAIRLEGYDPIFVYNSNGYDLVESLEGLDDYINVYLPDFKYAINSLARDCSNAPNYRFHALTSIREMYRQRGSTLIFNDEGLVEKGLIIRHLILPGFIDNSKKVLCDIASISESIAVSLMAQYWPTVAVSSHPILYRTLAAEEYEEVADEFESLGFYQGWMQEIGSHNNYLPHFDQEVPFRVQH